MIACSPFTSASRMSKVAIRGSVLKRPSSQRATLSAPSSGRSAALRLPPPSLTSTTSGASSETTCSRSPDHVAARNSGHLGMPRLVDLLPRLPRVHVLASTMSELPYGGLGATQRVADLAEREVEHLTQYEGRPLQRRQRLEHDQHRHRHRVGELRHLRRILAGAIGSGNHGPTYCSRRAFCGRNRLSASRLVIRIRYARTSRTSDRSAAAHRSQVSCTTSSASTMLPTTRYAAPTSTARCSANSTANSRSASALTPVNYR